MEIREVTDLDLLKAFHDVETATFDHDFVALPCDPIEEYVPVVEGHHPVGEHVTMHVAYDGPIPVGALSVKLFTLDNTASANVELNVHPDHRRRGFGRQLLDFAVEQVRASGRSRVFLEAPWLPDGSEGPAFPMLRAIGAKQALVDARRLLDLQAFPVGEPLAPPAGYRVVQWVDRAPDDVIDGVAYLLYRMILDAPMGELDIEPEAWDAARYRASEADAQRRHRTRVATAVVHEESGYVAGITDIGVNAHRHDVAYQWTTIVDPDHRGQRLGMVLKSWNHTYLRRQVEGIRYINTWNAVSNSYMIAVNEALGFRAAEKWTQWQLDL